jgi:hypothetical protein
VRGLRRRDHEGHLPAGGEGHRNSLSRVRRPGGSRLPRGDSRLVAECSCGVSVPLDRRFICAVASAMLRQRRPEDVLGGRVVTILAVGASADVRLQDGGPSVAERGAERYVGQSEWACWFRGEAGPFREVGSLTTGRLGRLGPLCGLASRSRAALPVGKLAEVSCAQPVVLRGKAPHAAAHSRRQGRPARAPDAVHDAVPLPARCPRATCPCTEALLMPARASDSSASGSEGVRPASSASRPRPWSSRPIRARIVASSCATSSSLGGGAGWRATSRRKVSRYSRTIVWRTLPFHSTWLVGSAGADRGTGQVRGDRAQGGGHASRLGASG